jgi:uncharacterized protein
VAERIARAMVTGASAGIGTAFARQLAGQGVELVLVARRGDRLHALAGRLPVDTEVLVADLEDPADLDRVSVRAAADRDPVDLLVNDAGVGSYGPLADTDRHRVQAMTAVNVAALTRLTQAVLPQLLRRRTGGVINVGSTAGYRPCPYSSVYGASKAYVRSFTEAVHEEVRAHGVHVMLLAPGSTDTEFQQVAGLGDHRVTTMLRVSADEVAAAGLAAFASRRAVCIPGIGARTVAATARLVPSGVSRRASALATQQMLA